MFVAISRFEPTLGSMTSPFTPIFAERTEGWPDCLRDQYLSPADCDYEVLLAGTMDRVWHRPAFLWPMFWLMAKWSLFFPESGSNIPTRLVVTPGFDRNGNPIQVWERTFSFPKWTRYYRSTMVFDSASKLLVEKQDPENMLHEFAEIIYTAPGVIEFTTVRSKICLAGLQLTLPRCLWVQGHVQQVVQDTGSGRTRVVLTLTHSLLGPVFGYEGSFRGMRRPRSGDTSATPRSAPHSHS